VDQKQKHRINRYSEHEWRGIQGYYTTLYISCTGRAGLCSRIKIEEVVLYFAKTRGQFFFLELG
jgi:hypothetical protein